MQSTTTSPIRETDPHDLFAVEPDVIMAARPDIDPLRPTPGAAPRAAAVKPQMAAQLLSAPTPAPTVDATFRPTAANDHRVSAERPMIGRWVVSALVAVVFAVGSAATAAAWQRYGDEASEILSYWAPSNWMPRLALTSPALAPPSPAAQPEAAPTQIAAAEATPAPPVAPQVTPDAAVAALPPDSAQLLQSMAHDVATMGQQIEQLKASIEQLKAGQDQIAHDMAKASEAKVAEAKTVEPALRPRPPQAPRAAVLPPRKPRPYYPPAQTAAIPPPPTSIAPPVPLQSQPAPSSAAQPDSDPIVRPPMPVR